MKKLEQKNHNDLLMENYKNEQNKILLEIRNLTIVKIKFIRDKENSLINNITEKINYYEINYEIELKKIADKEKKLLSKLESLFDEEYKDKFEYEEENQVELIENF
ncbi:MAG: hypothetical protein AM1032_000118 [Mycoplasmataceae bacterium]|nr:MAG: hypothetical protein AM1032_000118 [Mycoplasmataceae bacterium]